MIKRKKPFPDLTRLYASFEDRLYYELAPLYDVVSWLVSLGQWERWRASALPHVHGGRVLEIGFGTGALLIRLARAGYAVCGLDLSPVMHRITLRRSIKANVRISQVQGVAQSIPLAPASCDTVISTFPAAFILDPATHTEIARVIAPGGRFILVDMFLFADNKFLQRLGRGLGILTEPELDWLEKTLTELGLSVHPVDRRRKGLRTLALVAER